MTSRSRIESALAENKRRMVAAQGDEEALKLLSGEKEELKNQLTRYCACGRAKSYRCLRCWFCNLTHKYGRRLTLSAMATVLLLFAGCSNPPAMVPPPMTTATPSSLTPRISMSAEAQAAKIILPPHVYVPRTNWLEVISWKASASTNVTGYQVGYFTNFNFSLVWYLGTTTNLYYDMQATNVPGVLVLPCVRAINQQGYVSKWLI